MKVEKNIGGYNVKLPVCVLIIKYFVWLATDYIYRMTSAKF